MPDRLAILSFHTSPLAQPGLGDGGGMNVYVRSLAGALSRAGVACDVYTRAESPEAPPTVEVEPGVRVHHVVAGPAEPVAQEDLPELTEAFADAIAFDLVRSDDRPGLFHANYWLSGVAGHALKHEMDLPLVSTFHTLARVKAEAEAGTVPELRASAEAEIVRCSDLILASTPGESDQLAGLYDAEPGRIEVVPPGVDHRTFSRGDSEQAKTNLGLSGRRVLLFAGRVQPLKGLDLAVATLAQLADPDTILLIVGGPSGPDGPDELARIRDLVEDLGVGAQVRFVRPQPHARLAEYYRAADVCLVPSRSESFGLVALEAAACGTPVVAAAVGGLRSLVDDGVTGFLVDSRDPAAFAAPVATLLADRALAATMSTAAESRSMRYSWDMTAVRLRRLYADVADGVPVVCR